MKLRTIRMRFSLLAIALGVMTWAVPEAVLAQCNGGDCPITGGSRRIQVGVGFALPGIAGGTAAFRDGQISAAFSARGAELPKPGAGVTVPTGQAGMPYSFTVQPQQLSYGQAPSTTPGLTSNMGGVWKRYAAPVLLQVPLFNFNPAVIGVSTFRGLSWPGVTNTFGGQMFGGPKNFRAGGRGGAATVTYCAGANVPDPIPATWTGSCTGFTPLTPGGAPGAQLASALVRYTRTANQFGGAADGTSVVTDDSLGRILFNNLGVPYTPNQMANTALPKIIPTLPQNLTPPQAWGADFGLSTMKVPTAGDIGNQWTMLLTPAGLPQNTATWMLTPNGLGAGLAQTSTTWGGPLTTGRVTEQWTNMGIPNTVTYTGRDQRTANGTGVISMVAGSIARRTLSGPGDTQSIVTLWLPEPGFAAGLFLGTGILGVMARRRKG